MRGLALPTPWASHEIKVLKNSHIGLVKHLQAATCNVIVNIEVVHLNISYGIKNFLLHGLSFCIPSFLTSGSVKIPGVNRIYRYPSYGQKYAFKSMSNNMNMVYSFGEAFSLHFESWFWEFVLIQGQGANLFYHSGN